MEYFTAIRKNWSLKETIIVDFLNKGTSHRNFNQSFLSAIQPDKTIFYANNSHLNGIDAQHPTRAIKEGKQPWFLQLIKIFFKSSITVKSKNLIFLATDNYFIPALLLSFFPFFLNKNLTIILHNNVGPLVSNSKKRLLFKVASSVLKIKFIALTKNGRDAMKSVGFKNTHFIPHMNFTHFKTEKTPVNIEFPASSINIVLIGRQAKFFIEKMLPKIDISFLKNIRFITLYKGEILNKSNNIIQIKDWLESNQLNYILSKADFSFFQNQNVKYRPSGILLDSITNFCPIIAPDVGHFSETKEFEVGFYYEKISDLLKILTTINNNNIKRDTISLKGFNTLQEKTSIKNFAKELNEIL